jgi:hypothetical protein
MQIQGSALAVAMMCGSAAAGPQPTVIDVASGQNAPTKLVVTSTEIVWIDEGTGWDETSGEVVRLAKTPGAATQTLAKNLEVPLALAVDATMVYFVTRGKTDSITDKAPHGGVWSVPLAGGKLGKLAGPRLVPTAVAVAGKTVYFADASSVAKIDKGVSVLHGKEQHPGGIAVDATRVYWSTGGSCVSENGAPIAADGSISSVPLAGGKPTLLATGLRCPEEIAIDDDAIYVASMDDGTVLRIPKAGGAATVAATDNERGTRYVAVDATAIYWANQRTGKIKRRAKAGGKVDELASMKDPAGIAVDDKFIYFTDSALGVIKKVAK